MTPTAPTAESASELVGESPRRFAAALAVGRDASHVVSLAPNRTSEAIVRRDGAGSWVAGDYAGELSIDGERLLLEPRIGWPALSGWVAAATDLSGDRLPSATEGLAACTALIWVRVVDGASRHGPPAFRRDVEHVGTGVRGRLDVRRTVALRARGATGAASTYRARDLDNAVARIIVVADRTLARHVGHGRWRTERVEDILPQMHSAVGRRAAIPGTGELDRMRYTPITRAYKWAADLSARIVHQDPVATTPLPGRVQGLVLDLGDVWTGAALAWARRARPDLRIDLDAGQIVLADSDSVRGSLTVLRSGEGGAPVLALALFGASPSEVQLPVDAAAGPAHVAAALAAA